MPYELPNRASKLAGRVQMDGGTGVPVSGFRYVLTTTSFPVEGRVVGRDRRAGLVLSRIDGAIRIGTAG